MSSGNSSLPSAQNDIIKRRVRTEVQSYSNPSSQINSSLKKGVLCLILVTAASTTLFVCQRLHQDKAELIQQNYSHIRQEYLDSFENQINHHEERIELLEKSQIESRQVIDGIKDIGGSQKATFHALKARTSIIESLIVAYKLPSVVINQILTDPQIYVSIKGSSNEDTHPHKQESGVQKVLIKNGRL